MDTKKQMIKKFLPNELGYYAESLLMCELALRGIKSVRLMPYYADDIITPSGLRIEIKSSSYSKFRKHWNYSELKYRSSNNNNRVIQRMAEVYVFIGFDETQSPNFFIIPSTDIKEINNITISYSDKSNNKYHKYKDNWEIIC
ncbi:hypothetical protein KAU43_06365 [candidate division WOR-3 bacterium]|nr:hypothetical protein [candidate division WOR-3 bacterium]